VAGLFVFSPAKLRALRKERGWSLSRLAIEARTSEVNVWRWETGVNGPRLANLYRLAVALSVDPADLCDPDPLSTAAAR
jgi:transcriptional regulator with XRE-family HTH domain